MHKPSLAQLVYSALFPRPRTTDPVSFSAHITRNLVPEVRIETSTFYGSLDCIEAQYPGLDYSYGPHRMRLSRFQWHRRLFRVFDELRLTEAEISSLCRWEGTKSARERYEKEEGVIVRDTTADTVPPAPATPLPSVEVHLDDSEAHMSNEEMVVDEDVPREYEEATPKDPLEEDTEADSSDEELQSYGVELNHRLFAARAAREQGADVPLDEVWEQWLKEASERHNYTGVMDAIRSNEPVVSAVRTTLPIASPTTANAAVALSLIARRYSSSTGSHGLVPIRAVRDTSHPAG